MSAWKTVDFGVRFINEVIGGGADAVIGVTGANGVRASDAFSRYFDETYPVGNFPSFEYSLHPVAIAGLAYILVPLGKDPKILELAFVVCLIFKPPAA